MFVSGELSMREYQATDGSTKTSLELNANIIDLVGKRNEQSGHDAKAPQNVQAAPASSGFDDEFDDIPF